MKFFIDTASIQEIKEASELGIIEGVTTNPSLVAKEGKNFKEILLEITKIVNGPISAEATALDAEGMVKQARELASWSKNIVVKIPMTEEGIKVVKKLNEEGIKTNVTLVFSVNQALLAAKAGATYVSPFIGRLDDVGHEGMQLVREIKQVFEHYDFKTQIIVASIRNPQHVIDAAKTGAHVATIPFKVLKQMFKHPLTDVGIKRFLEDWEKVPK